MTRGQCHIPPRPPSNRTPIKAPRLRPYRAGFFILLYLIRQRENCLFCSVNNFRCFINYNVLFKQMIFIKYVPRTSALYLVSSLLHSNDLSCFSACLDHVSIRHLKEISLEWKYRDMALPLAAGNNHNLWDKIIKLPTL